MSVGNRLAALPPGRSVEPGPSKNGRSPTESGVVLTTGGPTTGTRATAGGGGGAVTVTVAVIFGFFGKCAALATTVSRTDVTVVAVAGTATCA